MKKLISFLFLLISTGFVYAIDLAINIYPDTALIQAVKQENIKDVKKILKSKVNVNQLGSDHKTALDIAVELGNAKIAILLCKYGGHVTLADNKAYINQLCKIESRKSWLKFIALLPICCALLGGIIFFLSTNCIKPFYEALFWTCLVGYVVNAYYMGMFQIESKVLLYISEQNWVIKVIEE